MSADWDSPSRLGEDWHILSHRLCVKLYPTCYFMHRSFAAAKTMLSGRKLDPAEVVEVVVTMGRGQTAVLVNERPETGLEAKFSEQFAMAAAVILGSMGVEDLRDGVVQRPDIQAFFPKVRIDPIDEYDARDPAHSPYERVVIRLRSGEVLDSGEVTKIPGHAFEPLTTEELWGKFSECASKAVTPSEARSLFEQAQALPDLRSAADLPTMANLFVALLSTPRAAQG